MNSDNLVRYGAAGLLLAAVGVFSLSLRSDPAFYAGEPPPIAQSPLYIRDAVPPLNMLVMGKDHKNYYEAYNDASDLDGDGVLDVGYKGWVLKDTQPTEPGVSRFKIDYYGYFNSYACYRWDVNEGGRFVPAEAAPNKTCGRRSNEWSGDFLNYLTTSRMDALRRVLYGGWRQVDTAERTILQGAFFPQDAHSWGKEYMSVARDGYHIADYAPLPLPNQDRYHLFAVTTTTGSANTFLFPNYQAPRFRVLRQSPFRVWNWLSIEGPVAGNNCFNASNQRVSCTGGGTTSAHPGHPANRAAFDVLENNFAIATNRFGSGPLTTVDCAANCNPFGSNDNYLSIIEGTINVTNPGNYVFLADGDDAVDFQLVRNNAVVAQSGCYGAGGFGTCAGGAGTRETGAVALDAGNYTFRFRQEEEGGGDGYRLSARRCPGQSACGGGTSFVVVPSSGGDLRVTSATITTYNLRPSVGGVTRDDYFVRVEACPSEANLRDTSCKVYPGGSVKPTGILHDYGETQRMYFGLITGSQRNNLEGGVLRRNISDFATEIDPQTGVFRADVNGIVRSIDRLRMIGGGYAGNTTENLDSNANWGWGNGNGNCPSIGNRPINNGECRMWGNPIAEMMYESLRYFAGATGATPRFVDGGSTAGNEDEVLGLPAPAWRDPYLRTGTGLNYPACSRPYQTVISDINPSYDGDLPGSAFSGAITTTGNTPTSIAGFHAANEGQAIWNAEFGAGARNVFVGEAGTVSDGNPTVKAASSFGNIRGLSPEEPGKLGTYYSASVARFARNTRFNANAAPDVRLSTYAIALASPLPRIEFPIGNGRVTLVPFAKTVSGTFGDGTRKPTNTIVDFYVQEYANFPGTPINTTINGGRPYAVFRINYEDVEQGNDHDMDAIVRYEIRANANNTLTVSLDSEYAAGSANQNMGYIISGTTRDGVYLEVRDTDNANQASSAYLLNTPPGRWAGECVGQMGTAPCNQGLGFTSTREFSPSSTAPAIQLRDPLWYAAKYGAPEPTTSPTGEPDNYFLVTNPLNLRNQLSRAFDDIASRNLDAGSRTLAGARVGAESFTLQPTFQRERNGKDWAGNLTALSINPNGSVGAPLWNARAQLPLPADRNIVTIVDARDGTSSSGSGVARAPFAVGNLGTDNADQLGKLGITQASITNGHYGSTGYTADQFVSYLRGDQSLELGRGTGTLRNRSSVIGSIINSEPVIAAPRSDVGYGNIHRLTSDPMFAGYASNATGSNPGSGYLDLKRTRPTMVYVGANDGMLHAFNGNTVPCATDPRISCAGTNAGREMFAFIPNAVLGNLGQIPLQDARYDHRYYVDGQISVGDVKSGSGNTGADWSTILVGSTGGGARSVFALDVSNPSNFGDSQVLWERNSSVDSDIGHVYGKPLIVPLENGEWGVLFGNGYGARRSDPSLYILNAMTGAVIRKITANDGNRAGPNDTACANAAPDSNACVANAADPYNGLGQITAIDRSGNGKIDVVYGGDLQGNLWKFDLASANENSWGVANNGAALFTAQIGTERQPITGGMRVAAGPGAGVMVYFGTGRYLFGGPNGDNNVPANPTVQSLYAVFDNGTPVTGGRSALQPQTITGETTTVDGMVTRSISRARVIYNGPQTRRGWYLDLQVYTQPAGQPAFYRAIGERFIATPRIQSGRVFFTTFTPSEDSCNPGGDNFVYALDLLSGSGALANVQVLPSQTPACTGADCGGIRIDQGGAPVTSNSVAAINPLVPITGAAGTPGACTPGVDCPTFEECQVVVYPGAFVLPRPCGRQSWRQLR